MNKASKGLQEIDALLKYVQTITGEHNSGLTMKQAVELNANFKAMLNKEIEGFITNSEGEIKYAIEFVGGGWNTVFANSIDDANNKASEKFSYQEKSLLSNFY